MQTPLQHVLASYNGENPLDLASTIPSSWYIDDRIAALERQNVFGRTWQAVARIAQLTTAGNNSSPRNWQANLYCWCAATTVNFVPSTTCAATTQPPS